MFKSKSFSVYLFVLSSLVAIVLASNLRKSSDSDWEYYKLKYNKKYVNPLEESLRKNIFIKNKEYIEEHNRKSVENNRHLLGINQFTDMTINEINQIKNHMNNRIHRTNNSKYSQEFLNKILNDDTIKVPDSFDWRKVPNRVTPIRNQGLCSRGTYAFSTIGLLEGQMVNRNMTLEDLSAQNIVDCQLPDGLNGCVDGSTTSEALQFIIDQGGLASEENYPFSYDKTDLPCKFEPEMIKFKGLKGVAYLPEGDEEALKKVVSSYGPVAAMIDGSGLSFIAYKSGVFFRDDCETDLIQLYTPILVIGYGTDPKEGDYWLAKLPYSIHWGEKGYLRLARNKNNCCGIATNPIIATF